jgi:hypothetical protein
MMMREDFLHYLWIYKKFDISNLQTTQGEPLVIVNGGQYLQQAGPDFFNAQIIIDNQKWAGNIEMHIKSSDWYLHQHELDDNYNNVILHVVWDNDVPIFRKDNTEIPVLQLKEYVALEELHKYNSLLTPKSWIFCENQLPQVDALVVSIWQQRLFFERLERKSIPIQVFLKLSNNDWEAVLFWMLAKNFGLNTNGDIFLNLAQSLPFSVIRKEAVDVMYLEALLFGQGNLLHSNLEDYYAKELWSWYDYLVLKYKISKPILAPIQFFKHRPDNFPTIRLAQLAMLYHKQANLFTALIELNDLSKIYKLFNVSVSDYWQSHYNFDKLSPAKNKPLTHSFIDLLIINTIIPLQFAYAQSQGKDITEDLINLISQIDPEQNNIISKFHSFGLFSENALHTQALLQLKNEYCNTKRCLNCAIGLELLKKI